MKEKNYGSKELDVWPTAEIFLASWSFLGIMEDVCDIASDHMTNDTFW